MQPAFVHLRLHSEFSLVDGTVRIKPLIKRLADLGMPAIAVTEQTNLFSLVKFYRAALGAGIKPIAGADVLIFNPDDPSTPFRLTLLAQNKRGYLSLSELISRAYLEGQHQGVPMLQRQWLQANSQGLIALSGAMVGDIGRALLADNLEAARQYAAEWRNLFAQGFYLEIQRLGKAEEERYIQAAIALALEMDLPVVATNDVRFLHPKEFEAHEVRVCIHQGRVLDDARRPKDYTPAQYLRSSEEMQELFADIPEALENTVEIAKRCNLELTFGQNYLPDFPVPPGMSLNDYFTQASRQGLEERLAKYPPAGQVSPVENRRIYEERLATELQVIIQMGFPGYFMIVADFIQWAKNHGIPVGPGRGSGAGSLVAYALKITDLDPIEFDLLFERFLNPERVSMPDFDIDFCMDRRDEVIDYVANHYGRDHVSQIITYGSMAAKAVVRDVGRVLGHSYGFVDRLAKLIPFEIGMTLEKALQESPDLKRLYETEEEVKTLIDMALSLEGISRNAGRHAGGVVIAPSKLTDFSPLYCEAGGVNLVTQFDKDDVEAVGLVKFDFLGLRTLTIIDWALETINRKKRQAGEEPVDISQIPRDDAKSYALLKNAETTAVFQLESRGMKELIKKLKPDCFDDIIALVALFRPGPLESGMVDDYIRVKHGAKAEYAHPLLEPILKSTNGVILYQEQVMQIAREMSGYSLGGADLLRRAMGKKKAEEMAQQRDVFVSGAGKNGVEAPLANYIFDLVDKFSGYGFNKTLSKDTKIRTLTGDKNVEDCRAGDVVFSMNADGRIVPSRVLALHDHGRVPLWLVEFDDGTQEKCTLDHKWLTDNGQIPLWKILQMEMQVWGWCAAEARYLHASETMFRWYEHDSYRTQCGQEDCDVLLAGHLVFRRPIRATSLGWHQGYDLEIDHPAHNFLLASGLCCSNSHSAAYALVAYQTAWLKAHYPAAFMAAVLSSDMDNTDKVVVLIEECREMKLRINPPNINVSQFRFTVNDAGQIVYGLGAIKGVGAAAIDDMLAEREAHGEFTDLQDLCRRVDLRKVNRRVLEALVRAGAFDVFDNNRAAHFAALPIVTKIAEQHGKMAEAGQNDLFGFAETINDGTDAGEESVYGVYVESWSDDERLAAEKQTLGLYLTGHPIEQYEAELKNFIPGKISGLPSEPSAFKGKVEVKIAGLVIDIRTRQSKSGKTMAFILLDDRSGRIEVAAFNDTYQKYRDLVSKDTLLVVEGSLSSDDYSNSVRLSADKLYSIEQARAQFARGLMLNWDCRSVEDAAASFINPLKAILQTYSGGPCPIVLQYRSDQAAAIVQFGDAWRVHPADELLLRLRRLLGVNAVAVKYRQ
ncbi:MAG: DNA polymerase III subunit alpha [Gammaproteobacteria bacterium]